MAAAAAEIERTIEERMRGGNINNNRGEINKKIQLPMCDPIFNIRNQRSKNQKYRSVGRCLVLLQPHANGVSRKKIDERITKNILQVPMRIEFKHFENRDLGLE